MRSRAVVMSWGSTFLLVGAATASCLSVDGGIATNESDASVPHDARAEGDRTVPTAIDSAVPPSDAATIDRFIAPAEASSSESGADARLVDSAPESSGSDANSGETGGADLTDANGSDAGSVDDAAIPDAGTDAPCDYGSAQSVASADSLDLFGNIVYFNAGSPLPAGRYRAVYIDGCMKYASSQGWTIHAYSNGASAAWWFVGDTSSNRIVVPPGTAGWQAGNGAYANFADCVAANLLVSPVEFDFAGGKLGVWLLDSQYGDNVSGEGGRNPKWQLLRLAACGAE